MTAEPDAEPTAEPGCRWPVPPQDGYTVDDLFTLPDLPPHTELIDGSLVFVSPQRRFHAKMIELLMNGLRRTVPEDLSVEREMTVVLDRRNGPEPALSVVRAAAITGLEQTRFRAEDVLLAIEVVSPDSEVSATVTPSPASMPPPASRTSGSSRWPTPTNTRSSAPTRSTR